MPFVIESDGIEKVVSRCLHCLERNGGCDMCDEGYITNCVPALEPVADLDAMKIFVEMGAEALNSVIHDKAIKGLEQSLMWRDVIISKSRDGVTNSLINKIDWDKIAEMTIEGGKSVDFVMGEDGELKAVSDC